MNATRLLPWLVFAAALAGWEVLVRLAQIPHYILPAPSLVLTTLAANFESLAPAGAAALAIGMEEHRRVLTPAEPMHLPIP